MRQSRGSSRGMVKVALSALLAASGALLGSAGCSSEVTEGSGGSEAVGVVGQYLIKYCPHPDTGLKVNCGEEQTVCGVVKCVSTGNGCSYVPARDSDGISCVGGNGEKGTCAAGQCCSGCVRVDRLTREATCEKGTTKANCGAGGRECDACTDTLCSTSECNLEKGACDSTPIPDGKPCNDNSGLCRDSSCCRGCIDAEGACVAGNSVNECGKTTPQSGFVDCQDCDRGNVCSNYSCVSGECAEPTPKPGTCADNTVCNGTETCGDNECNPGTPLVCNDGNVCTDDSCDDADGCTYTNNTANCSDNNLCTITDKCSGGSCQGTVAPNCNDNNPCTTDACDPEQGCTHEPKPNNDPCDDGNECSTGDRCLDGNCKSTGGLPCDDSNACTQNTCNPLANTCLYPDEDNGTPCVHTNKCVQNSTCQNGGCSAGVAIVCDDANPCTTNACDPAIGCVFEADDEATCSDGDACTSDDACSNKVCAGTPVACAALDECHVAGTCDPETGKCDDPRADDGTECNEGGPGTCDEGKCVLLPVGGAGNEGGGPGGGGEAPAEGGNGSAEGGRAEPGAGGSGAAPSGEAGGPEPDEEVHEFVRQPGGCSCRTPGRAGTAPPAFWLAGLAFAAAAARRRRRRREARG
jgi:MYXO-CTERM domain-containing protein